MTFSVRTGHAQCSRHSPKGPADLLAPARDVSRRHVWEQQDLYVVDLHNMLL
jgi:hypothetical protein